MKHPLLHLLVAGAAAAGGWFAASQEAEATAIPDKHRAATTAAVKPPRRAAAAWAAQLPAVRAVPGAASEIAWVKWAMSIPDADIPAAIARLNNKTDFHALRYLYARWTKLDPAAAWASFRKSDIPETVIHCYLSDGGEIGSGMASSNLHTNPRGLIGSRMIASWLTVDPAAAKAFYAKLADKNSAEAKEMRMQGYYLNDTLVASDSKASVAPQELAAAALQREAGSERSGAIANAARKWMATDPAAACEWLRSLPVADRSDVWRYSLSAQMRGAPPALRTAANLAILEGQGFSSGHLAAGQNPVKYDTVMDPEMQSLHDTAASIRDWMTQDASAAKQWLGAQPESELRSLLAGEAAAALARTDVNAAVALLNNTQGGDSEFALRSFTNGWMESDARACLAWAEKIPDAATRDICLTNAALTLSANDPALALTTARTLADEATRDKVFATVKRSLSWNPAALDDIRARFPGDEWNAPER